MIRFPLSSAGLERAAVNRKVTGSIPVEGDNIL